MELNKIYNEDCLEIMSKMSDNFVDISITSPPYNIGSNHHKQGEYKTIKDDMPKEDYFSFINQVLREMIRVTRHHIFFNIQELSANFGIITSIRKEYDKHLKEIFIWVKSNPQPSFNEKQVSSSFEYIFCFSKDNPHNRQFSHGEINNKNNNIHRNVFYKPVNNDMDCREHNYRFPEWLPGYFITNFSYENDVVFDPFMGSGTTAKQAIKYKRRFIGSEISEDYCNIANKRIENLTAQQVLF